MMFYIERSLHPIEHFVNPPIRMSFAESGSGGRMDRLLGFIQAQEAQRRGLSRNQFAKLIGVSPSTLSYWLSGSGEASAESLQSVAAALGMPYQELAAMAGLPGGEPAEREPVAPELDDKPTLRIVPTEPEPERDEAA